MASSKRVKGVKLNYILNAILYLYCLATKSQCGCIDETLLIGPLFSLMVIMRVIPIVVSLVQGFVSSEATVGDQESQQIHKNNDK